MYSEYPLIRDDYHAASGKSAFRYGSVLGSLGVGALAMYYMDPDRGRRRRALVRDQAVRASRRLREARRVTAPDVANRSTGIWAAFRGFLRRGRYAPQGGHPRRAEFAFLQRSWSPSARLAAGVLGAGMMACAARHRSTFNIALGLLGGGLLLRAASNRQFAELAAEARSQLQHSHGALNSAARASGMPDSTPH